MFTDKFIEILQRDNITAYQIAKETGISQGLMGEYKKGIKLPTINNLIKIADYLDCSIDFLLGRTDVREVNHKKSNILSVPAHDDETVSLVAERRQSAHPWLDNPEEDNDDKLHHT